jgi:D-tyrosyl-tRNA(Tyr) deacylase
MRAVVQRVARATVRVDGEIVGSIGAEVATGRFRAHMLVELENDGPVTLTIDV